MDMLSIGFLFIMFLIALGFLGYKLGMIVLSRIKELKLGGAAEPSAYIKYSKMCENHVLETFEIGCNAESKESSIGGIKELVDLMKEHNLLKRR